MFSKIKQCFEDVESLKIFEARMLYSITNDYKYIRQIVETTEPAQYLRKSIAKHNDKPIVIWGAGFLGEVLLKTFNDIKWSAFIDNKPSVTELKGVPVYSAEEFFNKFQDSVVVIASIGHYREIEKQLVENKIDIKNIVNVGESLKTMLMNQYFDLESLPRAENEVFLDAGFFDGETTANFKKWCNNQYAQAIGIEPDLQNYSKYMESGRFTEKDILLNACVWNEEKLLGFNQSGSSSSSIDVKGDIFVKALKIDEIKCEYPISFIKMDIEGAEYEALEGARKTICEYKPKLAICVYHKKEDIWKIPELILDINPKYKFWLRHYSLRDAETVLYAV